MRRKSVFGLVLLLIAAAPASLATQQPTTQQKPVTKPNTTSKSSSTSGQTSSPPKTSTGSMKNWKTYCSEEAEYCVSYPPNWDVVGDVMEGNGIVMAPPQEGKDKSLWDEITASVTDLPDPEKGKERPSFDDILSVALKGLPGTNVQTLQRTEMELHGRDAELVRVSYDDKETGKPWIEEIVFIDDELAIYSIALRATPDDAQGLEDTFRKVVASWRPSEAAPAVPAKPSEPKKPTSKPPQ
jgi:hypothetical protein